MRVAIATLGCKANQYDSALIQESLEKRDFELVPFSQLAEIYIINTCTVTSRADFQCRQLIRRAYRNNPKAKIIVTGCYAQSAPEELKKIPGVTLVVGNSEKWEIARLLSEPEKFSPSEIIVSPIEEESVLYFQEINKFSSRTRFFLKIQDGCNSQCSYCIVPLVRGKSRSMPLSAVLEQLQIISGSGYQEVVLTGIHLGTYGLDLSPPSSLLKLLQEIERQKLITRVRLSSIEPNEVTSEFIEFLSDSKIVCPHLHLPLQSGDDSILQKMNRPYTTKNFQTLVEKLASTIKDICLGTDVIVGFPGEGEQEFNQTVKFIEKLPISYLHVFPFSPRKGTPAFNFSGKVPNFIVKKRAEHLRNLSKKKRENFYQLYLNKNLPVLVEAKRDQKTGLLKGLSRNYIPILFGGGEEKINQEITVHITSVNNEEVRGEVIK